jgi:hypothetical protein
LASRRVFHADPPIPADRRFTQLCGHVQTLSRELQWCADRDVDLLCGARDEAFQRLADYAGRKRT